MASRPPIRTSATVSVTSGGYGENGANAQASSSCPSIGFRLLCIDYRTGLLMACSARAAGPPHLAAEDGQIDLLLGIGGPLLPLFFHHFPLVCPTLASGRTFLEGSPGVLPTAWESLALLFRSVRAVSSKCLTIFEDELILQSHDLLTRVTLVDCLVYDKVNGV